MILDIIEIILLVVIILCLPSINTTRETKNKEIPTTLRNEYGDRFNEIHAKLDELLDETRKANTSPFGKDAAGVHDY